MPSAPTLARQRVNDEGSIGAACWKYSNPQNHCQ